MAQTATATFTPAGDCGSEQLKIYDERGEWVAILCGSLGSLTPGLLDLGISSLVPAFPGPGGTLSFSVDGKTAAIWDVRDQNGKVVPNGFYTVVFQQQFTDGTVARVSKSFFLMPWGRTADGQLTAWPNLMRGNGTVRITAIIGKGPADGSSRVKVYSLSGELLTSLTPSTGMASWDLTNGRGQAVASGLYLLVLEGNDPDSGLPVRKTAKVVVIR